MNFFPRSPWQKCLGCIPRFRRELQLILLTRLAEHSASWWVRQGPAPSLSGASPGLLDAGRRRRALQHALPTGSPSSRICKRLGTERCLNQDPVLGPCSALRSVRRLHALRATCREPELYEMHKLRTRGNQRLRALSFSVWLPV